MQKIYDQIFKKDSKGKTRVWFMEQDGSRYRTHAGILDGAIVVSEWTQAEATNVGRSNERDPVAQATFEVEAAYEKKLTREYHRTIEAIDGGAHFFKPMLAAKYEKFEPGFAQPKLDGVRCVMRADGAFSREGKPLPGAAFLHDELAPVFEAYPALILDGELYNHELRDDFNEVIRLVKKASGDVAHVERVRQVVQYHVYDIPAVGGTIDARVTVRDALFRKFGLSAKGFVPVETIPVQSEEVFDEAHGRWLEGGFEGSMWRCPKTSYEQKRSKSLRKRKEFQDEEFRLVKIEEGLGNWSGMAKVVYFVVPGAPINPGDYFFEGDQLKRYTDGVTPGEDAVRVSKGGIKGSQARARELLNEEHAVVTIQFFANTPDGVPRFPVATKFHGAARTL